MAYGTSNDEDNVYFSILQSLIRWFCALLFTITVVFTA